MFEDSLMDSAGKITTQSRYWSALALALNIAFVTALVVWPLLHPELLPKASIATMLTAPFPAQSVQKLLIKATNPSLHALYQELHVPGRIPTTVKAAVVAYPSRSVSFISLPGISAGSKEPAFPDFPGITGRAPIVVAARPKALIISSGVMQGNLLKQTMPQYPSVAKAAGIEGTVVLQATISTSGSIANLKVVSGPTMLREAALDAVRTWRYQPYLLNERPVEVDTTVSVVFHLGR